MKNIKKIILLASLALLPVSSSAQVRIGFSYDAAGNRVKRELVMSAPKALAKQQTAPNESQSYTDMLSDHSIKIYPNPTEGALKICVSGLKETERCSLAVYTSQGAQILEKSLTADNVDIDISNHPSGIYLLRIAIDNNQTTWKIIKR